MLLVVTFSTAARQTLRNVCASHETTVVRRLGRAALLAETELGAFLALRLREKHGGAVQVERTAPLNEFRTVPERVREAARAYEDRDAESTPYRAFAAGTDHPSATEMADRDLADGGFGNAMGRQPSDSRPTGERRAGTGESGTGESREP